MTNVISVLGREPFLAERTQRPFFSGIETLGSTSLKYKLPVKKTENGKVGRIEIFLFTQEVKIGPRRRTW